MTWLKRSGFWEDMDEPVGGRPEDGGAEGEPYWDDPELEELGSLELPELPELLEGSCLAISEPASREPVMQRAMVRSNSVRFIFYFLCWLILLVPPNHRHSRLARRSETL
jgi:hypothetical protein